jgi:hypothetical protein
MISSALPKTKSSSSGHGLLGAERVQVLGLKLSRIQIELRLLIRYARLCECVKCVIDSKFTPLLGAIAQVVGSLKEDRSRCMGRMSLF